MAATPKIPSRRKKFILRILLLIGLAVVLLAGIWTFRLAESFSGKNESLATVWRGIHDPLSLFPGKDRVVILIAGKDYDHDKRDMPSTSHSRSDTIMLVCADLKNKRLGVVSIPRDTKVEGPDGKFHKMNALLPMGGIKLLEDAIAKDYGVQTDYHVILKDLAVKNLVDAVGGVEVDILGDMFYEDNWGSLFIHLHKGRQRLTGDEAIGYVRFRKMGDHRIVDGKAVPIPHKSSVEEGDIRRTQRQQIMIHALMTEAMKPGNLIHADSIINTGFEQMDTNLTRSQMLALATIFHDHDTMRDHSATIPGADSMDSGTYFYVADQAKSRLVMKWLIDGDDAAGRKLVRVAIHNESGIAGATKKAEEAIDHLGYAALKGSSTKAVSPQSEVLYRRSEEEDAARDIGKGLGIANIHKDSNGEMNIWSPEIRVKLGSDAASTLR